jgi:hypothetical protein
MSPDEFDLFSTYLYLFGNKHVKYKLSFFRIFLMDIIKLIGYCRNVRIMYIFEFSSNYYMLQLPVTLFLVLQQVLSVRGFITSHDVH